MEKWTNALDNSVKFHLFFNCKSFVPYSLFVFFSKILALFKIRYTSSGKAVEGGGVQVRGVGLVHILPQLLSLKEYSRYLAPDSVLKGPIFNIKLMTSVIGNSKNKPWQIFRKENNLRKVSFSEPGVDAWLSGTADSRTIGHQPEQVPGHSRQVNMTWIPARTGIWSQ